MNLRWRRACADALLSAAAMAIVLIVLVAADVRVRERARALVATPPGVMLSGADAQVRDVAAVLILSAKTQSIEHGPVVVFVTGAAVLVLAMVRS